VLIRAHRQQSLCRAYIHAIAGRCGLGCSFREFDYGIDLTVHSIRRRGDRYCESGFNIDIQAKSSASVMDSSSHVLFDLEVKYYDDLRDATAGCPRILVLLVLPEEETAWTEQTVDHLLLRRCAFWMSLKGMAGTTNTATIRIPIPRTNVFSVEALNQLMKKVCGGAEL
jgi:hypothetical protein